MGKTIIFVDDLNLKPCPFCGGKAELKQYKMWHDDHGYKDCYEYFVACEKCKVRQLSFDTLREKDDVTAIKKAIEAWNRRSNGS